MALIPIENKRGGVALPKALVLYDSGTQKVAWDNSGYKRGSTSGWDNYGGATLGASNITITAPSSQSSRCVLTNNVVDLTDYCTLKVQYNGSNTMSVDISAINTSAYVAIEVIYYNKFYYNAMVSSTKNYYRQNAIVYTELANQTSTMTITKVWLEPYPTRLADGELYAYGLGASNLDDTYGRSNLNGTVAYNAKNITITPTYVSGTRTLKTVGTKEKVNLTNYSKVYFTYYTAKGNYTKYVDVSSLSGSYYICFETDRQSDYGAYYYHRCWIVNSKTNYNNSGNYAKMADFNQSGSNDEDYGATYTVLQRIWLE